MSNNITSHHNNIKLIEPSSSQINQQFEQYIFEKTGHVFSVNNYSIGFVRTKCSLHRAKREKVVSYKVTLGAHVYRAVWSCFLCGIKIKWCNKSKNELTPTQWKQTQKEFEEDEKNLQKRRETAAEEAKNIFEKASKCITHPYIERKRILCHGFRLHLNYLIYPIYDEKNQIVNIEKIPPNVGELKKGLANGRKKGCFGLIGEIKQNTKLIYLAEGMATAATIYEATGSPCAICFGATIMKSSYKTLRKLYPDINIIIAADNDPHKKGEQFAKEAGPYFVSPYQSDINDYYIHLMDEQGKSRDEALSIINHFIQGKVMENHSIIDFYSSKIHKHIDFIDIKSSGLPLGTLDNLKILLRHYGLKIRFCEMSKAIEFDAPLEVIKLVGLEEIDSIPDNSKYLTIIKTLCKKQQVPTEDLEEYIYLIARANGYHPFRDQIDSNPYEKPDHYEMLLKTIECDPDQQELKDILVTKFLISIVAAAYTKTGIRTQGVLTLQGAQYTGKTTWIEELIPPVNKKVFTAEKVGFDPTRPDDLKMFTSYLLFEIAEANSTTSKVSSANLKGHITAKFDDFRIAWGRTSRKFPRQTVMCATVNDTEFLVDDTGNRRWWVIRVVKLNRISTSGIDMWKVWGYIKYLYDLNVSYELNTEEMAMLNASNKVHQKSYPMDEELRAYFKFEQTSHEDLMKSHKLMSTSEIYEAIKSPFGPYSQKTAIDIGNAYKRLTGFIPKRRSAGMKYPMPEQWSFEEKICTNPNFYQKMKV